MLLRYVPAPHTILEGMHKLKPGHYLKYKQGCVVQQIPYFSWDPHASEVPVVGLIIKKLLEGQRQCW